MREVQRKYTIQPRGLLKRGADGRLKADSGESDIADVWAEQKRIALAEAIAEQKRKAARKQKRRERGLFGKKRLAFSGKSPSKAQVTAAAKEIEIKISLPKIKFPAVHTKLQKARLPHLSMKQWWLVAGAALVVAYLIHPITPASFGRQTIAQKQAASSTASSTSAAAVKAQTPDYATLLPKGKTIGQLGGWGRVSPTDKDPVFAYSDAVASVHTVVSEQPLPKGFSNDLQGEVQKLAKQFGSAQQLSTTGATAYMATSANGSQSVVVAKGDLLILMRSSATIAAQPWVNYIESLQ